MLEPYLPVMRVLCTIFVVYISIFWVLHQIRYDGSLEAETRKGGNDGVGTQDLTNLYMVSLCLMVMVDVDGNSNNTRWNRLVPGE